jgi:hypothetical protein
MSATGRIALIEEISASSKLILDELKNEIDLADAYLDSMRKAEKDINKFAEHIKSLADKIEKHMKEYRVRELNAVSDDLEQIYKQEEQGNGYRS